MDNEGRLREELARGAKADDLLRNPIFQEAFDIMRSRYATAWADTPPDDAAERERLYVAVNVLEDIYDQIVDVMQTGEMAGHELDAGVKKTPVH